MARRIAELNAVVMNQPDWEKMAEAFDRIYEAGRGYRIIDYRITGKSEKGEQKCLKQSA